MSSQDTRRKVRLNEKVESRVRGDLYARFGGECLETCYCQRWQGAGCLAYVYTTEESEKLELHELTRELGGNLELAVRRLAERKREEQKQVSTPK